MKGLFDYDNKFMQILSTLCDLIILNVLFLLCCVPVFTIGAAQAALCTGLRQLTNKEDDRSCVAAFFRGFTTGFGTITGAYCIMLVLILVVGYTGACTLAFQASGISGVPVILSVIGLFITAVVQTFISVFHSRFTCTVWQLFRNSWLMFIANLPRVLLCGLLAWLPVILLLLDLRTFIMMTPVLFTVAYSFLFLLINALSKKPFERLIAVMKEKETPAEEAREEIAE